MPEEKFRERLHHHHPLVRAGQVMSHIYGLRRHHHGTDDPGDADADKAHKAEHHRFDLLHERTFLSFWLAKLFSAMGSFAQGVSVAWIVLREGGDATDMGLVIAAATLPSTVLSLHAGSLADRFSRRHIVVITQLLLAVNSTVLVVARLAGVIDTSFIIVVSLISGVIGALGTPAGNALVRDLVGKEQIGAGVALCSLEFNVARVIGPAIAGVMMGALGVAACFGINAISFLIFALVVARLPLHEQQVSTKRSSVREGIKQIRKDDTLRIVILLVFVISIFGLNLSTLTPILANYVLEAKAGVFGLLCAATGVGSVAAATMMASRTRFGVNNLFAAAAGLSASLFLMGLAWEPKGLSLVMAIFGFGTTVMLTTANALLQGLADPEIEGRVLGVYALIVAGATPIGSLIVGWLSDHVGVEPAVLGLAVVCMIGTVFAYIGARRHGLLAIGVDTEGKV